MRQHKHTSVLLAVAALIVASASSAQERMAGSGIRITKDGEVALEPRTTSATAPAPTVSATGSVVSMTPFDISSYAGLNEKNITYLMATGDSLEISIGNLAQTRGTAQSVRDFGAMLVTDHTAHLSKTWEIITDEDVGIETIVNDNEGSRLRETLQWLRDNPASAEWDAHLLRFQAQHHQNVIDILSQNIKNAHDDDLEEHIEKSLASLAKHRDAAKTAARGLGVSIP